MEKSCNFCSLHDGNPSSHLSSIFSLKKRDQKQQSNSRDSWEAGEAGGEWKFFVFIALSGNQKRRPLYTKKWTIALTDFRQMVQTGEQALFSSVDGLGGSILHISLVWTEVKHFNLHTRGSKSWYAGASFGPSVSGSVQLCYYIVQRYHGEPDSWTVGLLEHQWLDKRVLRKGQKKRKKEEEERKTKRF